MLYIPIHFKWTWLKSKKIAIKNIYKISWFSDIISDTSNIQNGEIYENITYDSGEPSIYSTNLSVCNMIITNSVAPTKIKINNSRLFSITVTRAVDRVSSILNHTPLRPRSVAGVHSLRKQWAPTVNDPRLLTNALCIIYIGVGRWVELDDFYSLLPVYYPVWCNAILICLKISLSIDT